jgi:hypothetical protein
MVETWLVIMKFIELHNLEQARQNKVRLKKITVSK